MPAIPSPRVSLEELLARLRRPPRGPGDVLWNSAIEAVAGALRAREVAVEVDRELVERELESVGDIGARGPVLLRAVAARERGRLVLLADSGELVDPEERRVVARKLLLLAAELLEERPR
jgi:hypothetical protein